MPRDSGGYSITTFTFCPGLQLVVALEAVEQQEALELVIGRHGIGGSPDDLKAFIDSELKKWAPLIKDANIEL